MSNEAYQKLISLIGDEAVPLAGDKDQFNTLLDEIGDSRFVLIGEASHGTHEFYQARIDITKKLIEEKGFMAVGIEGDWPDAHPVHRYLQGEGDANASQESLSEFKRFPGWMWRNTTMPPFLKWLRQHNDKLESSNKVGFYGLDLYSLNTSTQVVIDYLKRVDPEAAETAIKRYSCFDHLKIKAQDYGYLVKSGLKKTCAKEVMEQLLDMQHRAFKDVKNDKLTQADENFYATQNARLVKNAENYYRTMYEGHVSSWNIRDEHMFETFNILIDHLENRSGKPAKIVIWAHNSHVGDARATEMSEEGELNIGQLVKEQHDKNSYLIGFSTYQGSVTAASNWDKPAEHKKINPGIDSSYEELFHDIKYKNFILNLRNKPDLEHYLKLPRLQRAIGVIYRPETERLSHYFFTRLPYQFDSIIHFDKTTALEPLDINPEWKKVELV